ncbi:MAG: hypothetical protein ACHREM_30925 [Polyangiales bacterium]
MHRRILAPLASLSAALLRKSVIGSIAAVAAVSIGACAGGGGAGGPGAPRWPHAEHVSSEPLPNDVMWQGVYFISTSGTRGMLHVIGEGDVQGCWMAEDHHAVAHFQGKTKDNVLMLDWSEKRVGFPGPPAHVTAYLVMTPDTEGHKDKVAGEYGKDTQNDGGDKWEGVRQHGKEPSLDACKVEAGDTVGTDSKPLD